MFLPDSVFDTLQRERNLLGSRPNAYALGVLLNAVAWEHRAEGFGLSRKVGGITVPFPGGGTICHDVLQLPDGTAWDVLLAAGEQATPIQGDSFTITDPARPWVAPVDPWTAYFLTEPVLPVTWPVPPLLTAPPVPPDLTIILDRLDALEVAVERLLTVPVQEPSQPSDWPEPCDPSDWEAAGRIAWWGVTLPLRRKRGAV